MICPSCCIVNLLPILMSDDDQEVSSSAKKLDALLEAGGTLDEYISSRILLEVREYIVNEDPDGLIGALDFMSYCLETDDPSKPTLRLIKGDN